MNTPQEWKVERAGSKDWNSARRLLSDSGLPTQGLEKAELWCVRDVEDRVVGIAGLETWGRQGLLRSVAVEGRYRKGGMGKALVERIFKEAKVRHLDELYLITETAPDFFEKFGFTSYGRENVKGKVLDSTEFKGACPETAPVMKLTLN